MTDTLRSSHRAPPARPSVVEPSGLKPSFLESIYARLLADAGIEINGSGLGDMQIRDPRVWRRIAFRGTLGLGEAYVDEWWDVERLDEFFMRLM